MREALGQTYLQSHRAHPNQDCDTDRYLDRDRNCDSYELWERYADPHRNCDRNANRDGDFFSKCNADRDAHVGAIRRQFRRQCN